MVTTSEFMNIDDKLFYKDDAFQNPTYKYTLWAYQKLDVLALDYLYYKVEAFDAL